MSLPITSFAFLLGAQSAYHGEAQNPGHPASSTVGMLDATAKRYLAVTA